MDRGIMGWDMGIGTVFYLPFWILVIAGISHAHYDRQLIL